MIRGSSSQPSPRGSDPSIYLWPQDLSKVTASVLPETARGVRGYDEKRENGQKTGTARLFVFLRHKSGTKSFTIIYRGSRAWLNGDRRFLSSADPFCCDIIETINLVFSPKIVLLYLRKCIENILTQQIVSWLFHHNKIIE